MALIKIKILSSIAGENFSHAHGDIIEVTPEIAKAWNAEGLSCPAPEADVAAKHIEGLQKQLADASGARDGLAKAKTDLEGKLALAKAEKNGAVAEREVHKKAAEDASAQLAAAQKAAADAAAKAVSEIAELTRDRDDYKAQAEELGAQLAAELADVEALKTEMAGATDPAAPKTAK